MGFLGANLEGAATAAPHVAITAALLVGLGFKPLYTFLSLCLIANTAPWPFGAMGIPVIVAGQCRAMTLPHRPDGQAPTALR